MKLSSMRLFLVVYVLLCVLSVFVIVVLVITDHLPVGQYHPAQGIESPKPDIKTSCTDWETISKRLLREDYHLDPIRREIIEDFISRNKGSAQ